MDVSIIETSGLGDRSYLVSDGGTYTVRTRTPRQDRTPHPRGFQTAANVASARQSLAGSPRSTLVRICDDPTT